MKSFSILLLFLINYFCGYAQATFEKKFTPSMYQYGREIFATPDNGFFLQGTIEKGWRNCYLIKTNSFGDTLWTRTYGTDSVQYFAFDMAKTADGGYVMCGDYQTVLTFPSMDSYAQKIDSNGNQVWFTLFGWTNVQGGGKDQGQLVKVLDDGSVIVQGSTKDLYYGVGNYSSIGISWRSYLAKFDNAGNFLDVKTVCLKMDSVCLHNYFAFDIEAIGNKIYWLGNYYDPSLPGYAPTLLAVFDSNLDTLFTIRTRLSSYFGLSKTSDGHLLLFGNGIITEMDTLGNVIWNMLNSSPSKPYEIIELSNGDFASIGGDYFIGPFDGGFNNSVASPVIYVNKYSATGSLTGSNIFNLPSGINYQLGYNIVETPDNGFAFVGFSDYDIWLVKTDSSGNFNISVHDPDNQNGFLKISPNPSHGVFTLSFETGPLQIQIYNSTGIKVLEQSVSDSPHILDISLYSAGIYFVRAIQKNNIITTKKLMIIDDKQSSLIPQRLNRIQLCRF